MRFLLPLRWFLNLNVRASQAVAAALPLVGDKPFWQAFERAAADTLHGLPAGSTVLDIGGGQRCVYAHALADSPPLRLVAVDVSADELALNLDVTETCVADVTDHLPFDDGSVDLVLSRAVLEHVDSVPAAVRNMARVLKPGGQSLNFIPCRYSLSALAARLFPFGLLANLVHAINPGSRGQVEFDVVYDRCYPSAMRSVFMDAGFRDVSIDVCWAEPGYFEPIFPLFLLTSAYEYIVMRLGVTRLAAYMIVSAVR